MATIIDHPLVQTRLTVLRDRTTEPWDFRRNLHEISQLLLYEATRHLATEPVQVDTPLRDAAGHELARPVTVVPILRAGLGMLNGIVSILTEAQIGHIGLSRDERTAEASEYYVKVPPGIGGSDVLLVDPMLATGGSAVHAAAAIKAAGAGSVRFVCVLAAPEGVERFEAAHPDVPVFAAAIDEALDDRAFIVPGLGDAGDRYFGTC
jgi:uracil phosphoribosyltransferase